MFSSRDAYDSEACPVRDELLGEMYRASEQGLPKLVESVPPHVRAMLALFCYRKSNLYALSREAPSARAASASSYGSKKPITLSTKPLSTFAPIDDELDEDFEAV